MSFADTPINTLIKAVEDYKLRGFPHHNYMGKTFTKNYQRKLKRQRRISMLLSDMFINALAKAVSDYNLKNNSVGFPYHNHKSKTFKRNRRAELKRRF